MRETRASCRRSVRGPRLWRQLKAALFLWVPLVILLETCIGTMPGLLGRQCDLEHPCGGDLVCTAGVCAEPCSDPQACGVDAGCDAGVCVIGCDSDGGCAADAGPWLEGFRYRRSLSIVNASPESIQGYALSFELDTASLIAAGKLQPQCQDLRVSSADSATAIPFWIQEGCNSLQTRVWIQVALKGGEPQTVLLYYGNPLATSIGSAANLFLFREDFSQDPRTSGRWFDLFEGSNDPANEFSWGGTSLFLARAVGSKCGGGSLLNIDPAWEQGWEASFRFRVGGGTGGDGFAFGFFHQGNGGGGHHLGVGRSGYAIEIDGFQNSSANDPSADHIAVTQTLPSGPANHLEYFDTQAVEDGAWHTLTVGFFHNDVSVALDGTARLRVPVAFDTTFRRMLFGACSGGVTNDHEIDDLLVRRYVRPEPTWGVGPEEKSAP